MGIFQLMCDILLHYHLPQWGFSDLHVILYFAGLEDAPNGRRRATNYLSQEKKHWEIEEIKSPALCYCFLLLLSLVHYHHCSAIINCIYYMHDVYNNIESMTIICNAILMANVV